MMGFTPSNMKEKLKRETRGKREREDALATAGTQSKKVTFAFAIGITPGRQNLGNPGTMPTTSKKDQWGLSEAQKKFISMLSLTFRLTLDQPSGSGSTKITLPDFPVCPSLWSRTMSLIFAGKENLAPTRQT